MGQPLLIVGASGRAAAASALRAGFEPFVIDLFADADTKRLCPVLKCDPADYPHGFIPLAASAPPGPWMYTGGLENHPDVVATISAHRPLWGNGPDVLAKVRDPRLLAWAVKVLRGRCPDTLPLGSGPPPDAGLWLRKPLASAAGRNVRYAVNEDFEPGAGAEGDYLQRHVDGVSMSAQFRADAGDVCFFGMTTQLIGTRWLHAPGFGYAGNILCKDASVLRRLIHHLPAFSGLGINQCWGIDFIAPPTGVPWTLEVNPRYTSAVEVLEHASGSPFLGPVWPPKPKRSAVGKGIYYAANTITFPTSGPWDDSLARCTAVWRRPDYADIPEPGTIIRSGEPVLTILVEAATEGECVAHLKARAAELDRLFGIPTPPETSP